MYMILKLTPVVIKWNVLSCKYRTDEYLTIMLEARQ
jgi:hypothetical protein